MFEEMIIEEMEIEMEEWTVIGLTEGIAEDEIDSVMNEILGM